MRQRARVSSKLTANRSLSPAHLAIVAVTSAPAKYPAAFAVFIAVLRRSPSPGLDAWLAIAAHTRSGRGLVPQLAPSPGRPPPTLGRVPSELPTKSPPTRSSLPNHPFEVPRSRAHKARMCDALGAVGKRHDTAEEQEKPRDWAGDRSFDARVAPVIRRGISGRSMK